MNLYLVQNYQQKKNSEIRYLQKYSHPSENMDSTNYLTIQITKCLR